MMMMPMQQMAFITYIKTVTNVHSPHDYSNQLFLLLIAGEMFFPYTWLTYTLAKEQHSPSKIASMDLHLLLVMPFRSCTSHNKYK